VPGKATLNPLRVKAWENNWRQSYQSLLELGVRLKYGLRGRQFWVAAAECEDIGRFIVRADEKLTAFVELETATQAEQPTG